MIAPNPLVTVLAGDLRKESAENPDNVTVLLAASLPIAAPEAVVASILLNVKENPPPKKFRSPAAASFLKQLVD